MIGEEKKKRDIDQQTDIVRWNIIENYPLVDAMEAARPIF
jgi:hypothetical protein